MEASEPQNRVVDRCMQVHRGYSYMMKFPIGRAYLDTRIEPLCGGTTEIISCDISAGFA